MADRLSKLEKAYRRHPDLPLFARLADLYLRRNMPFRALEICEKGCEHFPDYTTGFLVLSKCYEARGDFEAARKAMGRALRLDSENPVGFKRLSTIYQELGNSELAAKSLEQAARLDPLDREVSERMDQLTYSMRLESAVPTQEHFDTLPQEVQEQSDTFVLDDDDETAPAIGEDAPEEPPEPPVDEESISRETALETEPRLSAEDEEQEAGFLEDQKDTFEEEELKEEPEDELAEVSAEVFDEEPEDEEIFEAFDEDEEELEDEIEKLGTFDAEETFEGFEEEPEDEIEKLGIFEGNELSGESEEELEEEVDKTAEFAEEQTFTESDGEEIEEEIAPIPEEPLAPELEVESDSSPSSSAEEVGLWDGEEPGDTPANGDPFLPESEPVDLAKDQEEEALDGLPESDLSTGGIGALEDAVDSISSADDIDSAEESVPEEPIPAGTDEDTTATGIPETSEEETSPEELPSIDDLVFSMEVADSPSPVEREDLEPAEDDSSGADLATLGQEVFSDESEDLEPAPVAPVENVEPPESAADLKAADVPDASDQGDDLQKIAEVLQDESEAEPPEGPPPSRRPRETGGNIVSGLGPRDDDELIKLFQEIETQQTRELDDLATASASSIPSVPANDAIQGDDEDRQIATVTLAEIYTIQGLTQRAIDIYRQILDDDPDNEEIRGKLADLERGAKT